mmetsp:Transcript_32985/g.38718  ORF Transcript_32985/g.38718 Transcript_32985/m.38718 type:complete len:88 (+) Transcript_32985:597-860(+)|eukprot:CAMPEP_0114349420 /NCGR_PEP_ID=MMETSP0101-20121206/15519_1 /TAXON_ID=38822 ORGANISM="Pteridomonas danica, Strain PT" /NCGR_SAMPLE_ID=MMETSP0101 /ASSEMBLY_ACC=CAM_ASM_000211 /LENGTH=87 /DNA_ID=CAMNT_0001487985 /DNA_START=526 /DNA_END=789 /DNA_ORIENTATION=+
MLLRLLGGMASGQIQKLFMQLASAWEMAANNFYDADDESDSRSQQRPCQYLSVYLPTDMENTFNTVSRNKMWELLDNDSPGIFIFWV